MTPKKNQQEERKIQSKFIAWCREQGHKVGSVDNGIFVDTWGSKAAKKMTGGDKGVPDIILILNGKYRVDRKPLCCFVELKKEMGGVVSKEQNSWITSLNATGVHATVAHGYGRAVEWVRSYYQTLPPIKPFDEEEFKKKFNLK